LSGNISFRRFRNLRIEKITIKRFCCSTIIAIVFCGCVQKQEEITTLDNSNIKEHTGKSFFGDSIEDWDLIKSETIDRSLVADVINVEFDDGKIFVATRLPMDGYWSSNQLKVFDYNGKYLFDIGSQGRGPGEFLNIQTFRLDKKTKK
jgi:ABC-type uncharacterized transport system auxiliary subunit